MASCISTSDSKTPEFSLEVIRLSLQVLIGTSQAFQFERDSAALIG